MIRRVGSDAVATRVASKACRLNLSRISFLTGFTGPDTTQIVRVRHASIDRMLTAHRTRTSLVLGAAGASLIAAWLLTPRAAETLTPEPTNLSSNILSAKFASKTLLASQSDQDIAVTITMPK